VALCGAGWISMAHAAATRYNGFELVAVASRSAARAADQAAAMHTVAVAYADLPGTADIVVVATPPPCHAADTIRLLDAGAAVLVEKPLCTTLEQADALVSAAAAHGQRLLYGENLAYSPVVQELVARVPGIGPLGHLEVRTLQSLPTWGAFTTDEWGGGALLDLGVHPLAIALLVASAAGEGRATSVSALLRGGDGHASDEHAEVTLTFASGVTASVVASWQGGTDPVWDIQVASATDVLRAELMPDPTLEHNGEPVVLPPLTAGVAAVEQFGYLGQLRALATDIAAGDTPVMSAAFGREVLQIVCAAYTSAGRGSQPIALPFAGPRDRTPLELWRAG
jgi:myo-inositol 2-dehydrogenase/D-chiro-inositol 1-dehydrogenase